MKSKSFGVHILFILEMDMVRKDLVYIKTINTYGTVHYLPKFEKPEIHLKHLKTSYTSQKLGLTFFKDYGLVKPRLHQTGQ